MRRMYPWLVYPRKKYNWTLIEVFGLRQFYWFLSKVSSRLSGVPSSALSISPRVDSLLPLHRLSDPIRESRQHGASRTLIETIQALLQNHCVAKTLKLGCDLKLVRVHKKGLFDMLLTGEFKCSVSNGKSLRPKCQANLAKSAWAVRRLFSGNCRMFGTASSNWVTGTRIITPPVSRSWAAACDRCALFSPADHFDIVAFTLAIDWDDCLGSTASLASFCPANTGGNAEYDIAIGNRKMRQRFKSNSCIKYITEMITP